MSQMRKVYSIRFFKSF